MPNPYAIAIIPDSELGEAINNIINATGFGSATYLVKEFLEKHKDELIAFWNQQGKDGEAIYEKWLRKWSLTKAEQEAVKAQKEKTKRDKLIAQYQGLGVSSEQAEELATAFPEKDPIEVVKIRTYNIQNKPSEIKQEQDLKAKDEKLKAFMERSDVKHHLIMIRGFEKSGNAIELEKERFNLDQKAQKIGLTLEDVLQVVEVKASC